MVTGMKAGVCDRNGFEGHLGPEHPIERATESLDRHIPLRLNVYHLVVSVDARVGAAGNVGAVFPEHLAERVL